MSFWPNSPCRAQPSSKAQMTCLWLRSKPSFVLPPTVNAIQRNQTLGRNLPSTQPASTADLSGYVCMTKATWMPAQPIDSLFLSMLKSVAPFATYQHLATSIASRVSELPRWQQAAWRGPNAIWPLGFPLAWDKSSQRWCARHLVSPERLAVVNALTNRRFRCGKCRGLFGRRPSVYASWKA